MDNDEEKIQELLRDCQRLVLLLRNSPKNKNEIYDALENNHEEIRNLLKEK